MYRGGQLQGNTVSDEYLDGISITSNTSHVWSFVAGSCDDCSYRPGFIGNDWTCDEYTTGISCNNLWDTNICGRMNPFFKDLSVSTTADIQVRVCRDERRDNEDIAITSLALYVQ